MEGHTEAVHASPHCTSWEHHSRSIAQTSPYSLCHPSQELSCSSIPLEESRKGCSPHGGWKQAPLFLQADSPAWFSSLWHKHSGTHFSSPVTLSQWKGRLETALGFKDYVARPGFHCDSSRSGWKMGRARAGTQLWGGKRSTTTRSGIPSRMPC